MIAHSKPDILPEECDEVARLLATGMIARLNGVSAFERAMSAYLGAAEAVAACSGTAALVLALKALGVGPGDDVVLPTYVCHSVLKAVQAVGAAGVLCDIGPDGWNMTPESVAPAVTTRTRAIVVVHTFGIASDTAGFASLGVPLVEDCCQSLGARRRGQQTAMLGQVAVYSFHATKCLTTGEGGMVVSRQRDSLAAVRQDPLAVLTDMQAVLGLRQLARYDQMLARRRAIADRYFAELPAACTETLRRHRPDSMFFRFPLTVRRPFAPLQAELAAIGVQVRKGVDALLHRQVGLDDAGFPNAVERFNRTVSVPLYPALADAEVESVIAACRGALAHE